MNGIDSFKEKARSHQINFRENTLCLKNFKEGCPAILHDDDAKHGAIFYTGMPGVLDIVRRRYVYQERKEMYSNMLRSEHIPFNFFAPLILDPSGEIACRIFQNVIGKNLFSRIKEIRIEWAPCPRKIYLDDLTSFDVFIMAANGSGDDIGIGIEIKYTEQSYPWGDKERKRMLDKKKSSPYHNVTSKSKLYTETSLYKLATPRFKQLWRNHILGESLVQHGCLKEFISVLFFPSGNLYQGEIAKDYLNLIRLEYKKRFMPITFEQFIKAGQTTCTGLTSYLKWLNYLEKRYIVQ